jgi:antagonist of KipI
MAVTIIKTGMQCSVQDLGRYGNQRYGVPISGAMDRHAASVANLLVGNRKELAVLEFVIHGAVIRFDDDALIAFSGSGAVPFATTLQKSTLGESTLQKGMEAQLPVHKAIYVPKNTIVELQYSDKGCRMYMAVAGGIDVPEVMGSRSTYLPAGAGEKISAGSNLEVGAMSDVSINMMRSLTREFVVVAKWGAIELIEEAGSDYIRFLKGAEWEQFTKVSQDNWLNDWFTVSNASDRMGIKLEGGQLARVNSGEMISTAVTQGTVQVIPDGSPLILMADAQTTGGYPRIAQIINADLHILAQKRPGDKIRFRAVSPLVAEELYISMQEELKRLERNIKTKFSI